MHIIVIFNEFKLTIVLIQLYIPFSLERMEEQEFLFSSLILVAVSRKKMFLTDAKV